MNNLFHLPRLTPLAPHVLAAGLALTYAWHISRSPFFQTGLQFIAPLIIILLTHLFWLAGTGRLTMGFARVVLGRSSISAFVIAAGTFAADYLAPMPSHAVSADGIFAVVGMIVFCLLIIAIVLLGVSFAVYFIAAVLTAGMQFLSKSRDHRPKDVGSLVVASVFLVVASMEGVPGGYAFKSEGHSITSHWTSAPPNAVWRAMDVATSPDFPRPAILKSFPQPIAVIVDEGVGLNANRIVRIKGREGEGELHLRVIERTSTKATFQVISDSSPVSKWVKFNSLSYEVLADGGGTRLNVRLDYDRLLSPKWVFAPMIKLAGQHGMDVLARDTGHRAKAIFAEEIQYNYTIKTADDQLKLKPS
ncbi:MAG: hypothetical protein ACKVGZ_14550 [Alphaproteobacteria bacterium]